MDVCNTMLDPTLPLTVADYDEWGNPEDPTYFNYIREYSPYDTLKERTAYPALLVLASLNDTRYDLFSCIHLFYFIMNCRRLSRNLVVSLALSFFPQTSQKQSYI